MSLRLDRPSKQPDDASIKWANDISVDVKDETVSISSEEEIGSEYDGEQRARSKSIFEIWDNEHIWNRMQVCL